MDKKNTNNLTVITTSSHGKPMAWHHFFVP